MRMQAVHVLGELNLQLLREFTLGAGENASTKDFGDGSDFLVAEGAARNVLVGWKWQNGGLSCSNHGSDERVKVSVMVKRPCAIECNV